MGIITCFPAIGIMYDNICYIEDNIYYNYIVNLQPILNFQFIYLFY